MKIFYFATVLFLALFSCGKAYEPFEYNYLLGFEMDGVPYVFETTQFRQDEPNKNSISCNYNSTCPWPGNTGYCMLSYMSSWHTAGREFFFMVEYRTLEEKDKLALNPEANPQYPLHIEQEDIGLLFTPKTVAFAEGNTAQGIILQLRNENTGVTYHSYNSTNISINPKFSFEFKESPPVNGFPYADKDKIPLYLMISHASFSAILYNDQGDSIMITNGEFRLPFCE
jgi:hypothetical protein